MSDIPLVKTAVILAAGLGSRIADVHNLTPKGFIKIGEHSLIERSFCQLSRYGIERFIIGTGHQHEYYELFFADNSLVECVYNPLFAKSGSLHTLITLADRLKEDFLLLESDLIYENKALKRLLTANTRDAILTSGFSFAGDEVFVGVDTEGYLSELSKNRNSLINPVGELVGISKISVSTLHILTDWVAKNQKHPTYLHYEEGLVSISGSRVKIAVILDPKLIWAEIDNNAHLKRVENDIYPKLIGNK